MESTFRAHTIIEKNDQTRFARPNSGERREAIGNATISKYTETESDITSRRKDPTPENSGRGRIPVVELSVSVRSNPSRDTYKRVKMIKFM